MRYGLSIPNFGDWADPRTMIGLARDAEAAGWDGFFIWDHIRFSATPLPVHDPWRFGWDNSERWPETEPVRDRIHQELPR